VYACRIALREAFAEIGAPPFWREWDRNASATPLAYRRFGSPTVLVNGVDIGGPGAVQTPEGNSCRLYHDAQRACISGAPSVTTILNALLDAEVKWNV
jgi:hypothetical protein